MNNRKTEGDRFQWRLPLSAAIGAAVVLLALILYGPDADLLYVLLVTPIVSLTLLIALVIAAVRKRPARCLTLFVTLVVFLGVSATIFKESETLRSRMRWMLWSKEYKAQMMATPDPMAGELKHFEWDGWGWAGMDTAVYLVRDPNDSLAKAAKGGAAGRFSGIPCEVAAVRRLERQWYAVRFYTDEIWGQRNSLDCRSATKK